MRIIYFILLICSLSVFSLAQIETKSAAQKLDDYFTGLASELELHGSVLVAEDGKIIYEKSFGYSDIEAKKLNTKDTEFQLASISKIFTAVAVLQLKEKGKLSLDDKFVKYFPDFPYAEVNIRHLLSHTSGLPDYGMFNKLIAENPERVFENKDIIPVLKDAKVPLEFTPGEKWDYRNLNFSLLALLVEKLSGRKFEDYLKKNVFEPAKMTRTYVKTALINPDPTPNFAYNHVYPFLFSSEPVSINKKFTNPEYKKYLYNHGFIGDSNVYSTTGDLLKFDQALYNAVLLKNETLEEAMMPAKLNSGADNKIPPGPGGKGIGGMGNASNGLGWMIFDDTSAGKIVWHAGGTSGAVTIFFRNVTKKQTVIVLDNTYNTTLYPKAFSAMNILNEKPILPVKRSLAKIYGRTLIAKGADSAAARLNALKADTENYYLRDREFNNMAWDMMMNGYKTQAIEASKLNTFLFPADDNVYGTYGELLFEIGKKEEAILMYKKALKINPENKDVKEALKKAESLK